MDRSGGPLPGVTYNGFSGPAPQSAPAAPAVRRPVSKALVAAGVAAAVGFGLLVGSWTDHDMRRSMKPPQRQAQPAAVAAAEPAPQMDVEVLTPAPPPAVAPAAGRLEVLPPAMAEAAARSAVVRTGLPPPPPIPVVSARGPAPSAAIAAPPVLARAGFDCGGAHTYAEQMVCSDPQLAAADRRLERAYRRALQAGAPRDELSADQEDWLAVRELAARRSPGAVAAVYQQRIEELESLDDGPG